MTEDGKSECAIVDRDETWSKEVCIRGIGPTAPKFKILKPFGVILSFDGIDVANDGTGEWDKCSYGL